MCSVRAFELVVAGAVREGRIPGLLHLCIGAEAVIVGVASRLDPHDRGYSSHRPHGHFLALTGRRRELLAELAGRESGMCRGRGGSMHLMHERAVMATGVVGGTLPIAVGHALTLEPDAVVVCFFGDGAVQTGLFHESMNLAALWHAPILFVCENNGMAEFSLRQEHTTVARVADYGPVYGIPALTADGTSVTAVWRAVDELLPGVRARTGPALLECNFERLRPHYEGDLRRIEGDARDPLDLVEELLTTMGLSEATLAAVREAEFAATAELLAEVLNDDEPDPAHDLSLVFTRWP
jgi:TPP-dependent pyruvate/acetoin dehydrogenase alpha subunit